MGRVLKIRIKNLFSSENKDIFIPHYFADTIFFRNFAKNSIKSNNMKYPIGIQDFGKIRNDNYVYLDKTELIYDLVHNGNIYFLSRPRRFGKSLLISTLECYFQGKKELFKGLAIEQLEKEWKQYPVFHIDFNGKDFTQAGELEKTLQTFVETHELIYGRNPLANTMGDRFMAVLKAAHEKTGLGAVILIDEYDKP